MQMLNYSNASGVAFAGLTDGNHWELYDVFRKDTLDKRRVLELSISDIPAHKCALELLLLWRPNLASGKPIEANKPVITVSPPVEQTNPIEQTNKTNNLLHPRTMRDGHRSRFSAWNEGKASVKNPASRR